MENCMDYRYETKDDARDFHKARRAFIIYKNKVEFLPSQSAMSHYEYCKTKGIEKDKFNTISRGWFLNGNMVFYKDNWFYDDELIKMSLKFIPQIAKKLDLKEFNIYFGQLPQENFKLDYFYGVFKNHEIIPNTSNFAK